MLVSVVSRDALGCLTAKPQDRMIWNASNMVRTDEYIPSIEAGFSDGLSYSCLIPIHLGRLYVPVASFEGF